MPNKYKVIICALVMAIANLSIYIYSRIILDLRIDNSIKSYSYAPANYQKTNYRASGRALVLSYNNENTIIEPATVKSWFEPYIRDYTQTREFRPSSDAVNDYLNKLAEKVNILPINARLDYQDGLITAFSLPQKGRVINNSKSFENIRRALVSGGENAELVLEEVDPQITLQQIDTLGIKKLLGHGESDFAGSSNARVHNIKISAQLFNGILIKPGEELSFNNVLGNVDAINGYLPELVIKNRGLAKEYGGGICQVSTTMFRAVIFSGLKILERRPHSFPVKYYNPQGFDSTIYPGQADLRFQNDTASNILVQTKVQGTKINFDFYGDDDRTVTVTKPIQYDIRKNGAMKAVFTRTIAYTDGETKKEEFRSNYKAPLSTASRNPLE